MKGLAILSRYPFRDYQFLQLKRNHFLIRSRDRIALAMTVDSPAGRDPHIRHSPRHSNQPGGATGAVGAGDRIGRVGAHAESDRRRFQHAPHVLDRPPGSDSVWARPGAGSASADGGARVLDAFWRPGHGPASPAKARLDLSARSAVDGERRAFNAVFGPSCDLVQADYSSPRLSREVRQFGKRPLR